MLNPATPWSYIRRWRGQVISRLAWPRPGLPGCTAASALASVCTCLEKTFPICKNYKKKCYKLIHFQNPLIMKSIFYNHPTLFVPLFSLSSSFLWSCAAAAACHGLLISSWKMGIGGGAQSGCGQLSHTLTHISTSTYAHTHTQTKKQVCKAAVCKV